VGTTGEQEARQPMVATRSRLEQVFRAGVLIRVIRLISVIRAPKDKMYMDSRYPSKNPFDSSWIESTDLDHLLLYRLDINI
jgi:hypothetical protein